MHCSSITLTDSNPPTTAGRMAPVGQDATRVGISETFLTISCLIFGGLRCIPRMAMSEQCTAPHMLRQQAIAMRTRAGRLSCVKRSYSASITDFTIPEASVAAEWQWLHPWVWTTLLMEAPVPPTG